MHDLSWYVANSTSLKANACHVLTAVNRNPDYIVWAHVELCVGAISACLPMFKPLFKTVFKSSSGSYGRQSDNRKGYRQWLHPSAKDATDNSKSVNRMEEDDAPVLPKLSDMHDFSNGLELQERKKGGSKVSVTVSDSGTTATLGSNSSLANGPRLEAQTGLGSY